MKSEQDVKTQALTDVAQKMLLAARTAPKGKGADNIVISIALRDTIERIAAKLKEMGKQYGAASFLRDAENILLCEVMLVLGTKIAPLGLKKCGLCGFGDCQGKAAHPDVPCAFNTGDLGIALGSAVSVAADHRVDNRIMYSAGMAITEMGFLGKDVRIAYAVPLSATSKSPFFDRG